MTPKWRLLLVVLACLCFSAALSYPILYALQSEGSSSGMESLSSMRQKGLSSTQTAGTPEPMEVQQVSGEDLPSPEDRTEGSVQELTVETGEVSGMPETEPEMPGTEPGPETNVIPAETQPVAEESGAADGERPEGTPETQVSQKTDELSETTAASDDAGEVPAGADELAETVSRRTPSPEGSTGQAGTDTGGGSRSDRTPMPETAKPSAEKTPDGPDAPEETPGPDDGTESETDSEPEQGTAEALEAELARELIIVMDDGTVLTGADPGTIELRMSPEWPRIMALSLWTAEGRLVQGAEVMVTPKPTRPRIQFTPSPRPTTTPDRRVRTDMVLSYPEKEKVELDEEKILPELRDIYEINHDLVGWLTIPGTYVDYPVVQSNEKDEDYYLKHDFYGKYNKNGQLILDRQCDPYTPSYHLIISGHHMINGNMFGYLVRYYRKEYWESRKFLRFDTLMEHKEYVIFAAFYSADYDVDEEGFRYSVDIQYRSQYNEWIAEVRANQLYDTGIDVEFGDEFITLTTCAKNRKNGRFVCVARRIREGESFE